MFLGFWPMLVGFEFGYFSVWWVFSVVIVDLVGLLVLEFCF